MSESANGTHASLGDLRAVSPSKKDADFDAISAFLDAERSPAEAERLRQVRAVGVEPESLSRQVRRLLLGREPLFGVRVGAVVADLSGIGLDVSVICQVLELIGVMLGPDECRHLVERAEDERERVQRPGENFSVVEVERHRDDYGVYFVCTFVTDAGTEYRVALHPSDLSGEHKFVSRCLSSAAFVPLLKGPYRGPGFRRFAALLIDAAVIVA